MKKYPFRIGAMLMLALVVSSCQSEKRLQYCPGMSSVLDAVVVTQFKPGAPENPNNALYTATISDVSGSCSFDKRGKTADSSVDVSFTATRPVGGAAANYTVPYFVAVTQSTRVITRETRSITISFAEGATTATAEDNISSVHLVTDGDNKPYDYQILVGFQLTKEQYDYNKTTGIFQQ
ncbi:MAG: hypothetical protein ACTHLR_05110 [Rhizomicrobium sp.]